MESENYIPETQGPSEREEQRVQHIEKFGWRRTLAESLAAMQQGILQTKSEREAA